MWERSKRPGQGLENQYLCTSTERQIEADRILRRKKQEDIKEKTRFLKSEKEFGGG